LKEEPSEKEKTQGGKTIPSGKKSKKTVVTTSRIKITIPIAAK
jgi:hypothetical protein